MFDYGSKNMQIYNSDTPPTINLGNINKKVPIAIFVGKEDPLANINSGKWLIKNLQNANIVLYRELDHFDHSTFNFPNDMNLYYIDELINILF